ncbi:Do family serine endopeptidase [Dysgonomonas macrotermitis]|uniref:Do/DeqQ family serine protease n=1 Tax=Dysgonomonas macrotermitis TaxID=1346286 RepID=A0A1M5E0I0_9BACT|nr:Do family serine endopeptidase [Dysgonomonas macrotermitis]SHF72676.1 Do/DeqQ family serine protease [Dysgonomonas macrotermitis]
MKKLWKNASTYIVAALISVGASYGTFSYLNGRSNYSTSDVFSYAKEFNQENVHLASLTSEGYPDFTKAAESTVHAVVHIKSTVKPTAQESRRGRQQMIDPFEYFFGFGDRGGQDFGYGTPKPSVGFGSGVIISNDGYIITNNHVIDKATEIEITMNDNSKYTAKLVGADPTTDIALLKIEGKEFPYIPFGNSDNLKVGEWVLAVGNPFNLTSTVTAGIVSAKGRGNIGQGQGGDMTIQSFIQTDAAINPGNSGGALVNTDGQLVGINTAIYSQTGNFAGYGFAVPISIAGKVVADIKEYGTVQRAVLGVMISDVAVAEEASPEKAKNLKVKEGAFVGGFAERSPAKEAGVTEGDVITAVNNTKVRNVGELQEQVNRYRPGDKVDLTIDRYGSQKKITVELKNSSGNTSVVKKTDGLAIIGAAFKELTPEQKKQYGVSYGVQVAGVDNGGRFKKEGIEKGFIIMKINNQSVSSSEEAESIIQSVGKSQDKGLFISGFYPNGRTRYYAIDLGE